jgi:hypothetical protein
VESVALLVLDLVLVYAHIGVVELPARTPVEDRDLVRAAAQQLVDPRHAVELDPVVPQHRLGVARERAEGARRHGRTGEVVGGGVSPALRDVVLDPADQLFVQFAAFGGARPVGGRTQHRAQRVRTYGGDGRRLVT